MHPEIEKFWKDSGKTIGGFTSAQCHYWFVISDSDYYNQGGPPPPLKHDVVCIRWVGDNGEWLKKYYLCGGSYTEAEMLKIIKLKAFI